MGSGGAEGRRETTPDTKISEKELADEDARRQAKNARACDLHLVDLIRWHGAGQFVAKPTLEGGHEMLVIDIKTKGESYPISFIWRGNAEESRSLYEQIEDVSVREGCDANDMAAQVIKRDRRIPVFLALLMIFATSYVVALRRPGFERKGHRVAFFAGDRCAGGRHDIDASIRATELCRIDEDMPLLIATWLPAALVANRRSTVTGPVAISTHH